MYRLCVFHFSFVLYILISISTYALCDLHQGWHVGRPAPHNRQLFLLHHIILCICLASLYNIRDENFISALFILTTAVTEDHILDIF